MIREILIPLLIFGVLLGGALHLARWRRKTGYILAGCFGGVILLLLFFVRNPARSIPGGDDLIVAPADGRVVSVASDSTARIAIFLSLADVHVNRIPCGGRVVSIRHIDGTFHPAFSTESGRKNERQRIHIQNPNGDVILTQIAGMVARRIVCKLSQGQEVQTGEVFGMIKLGSRVELELPGSVQILVGEGDRVRAGETVIGRFVHDHR